jgi:osmotically-inducible protein OsmY
MTIRRRTRYRAALFSAAVGLTMLAGCERGGSAESVAVKSQLEQAARADPATDSDRALTQRIRQALMDDQRLSSEAKNVSVVSRQGNVTLRGTLRSADEKSAVIAAVVAITGPGTVVDELTVAM